MSAPRHFLTLEDFTEDQLRGMLAVATELKARLKRGERPRLLPEKMLAMIFEKQSTRTRVSFDVGMRQLGGETMFMTGDNVLRLLPPLIVTEPDIEEAVGKLDAAFAAIDAEIAAEHVTA